MGRGSEEYGLNRVNTDSAYQNALTPIADNSSQCSLLESLPKKSK